jgi:arylsulfatase A-like enzyme
MRTPALLLSAVAAATAVAAPPAAPAPAPNAKPPNVVLIISDDHAWTDYGFLGHAHIRTPHLDKLAAESLRWRWVLEGRHKLIVPADGSAPELCDVAADPAEEKNLAAAEPELVGSLRRRLDGWWNPGR